MDNRRISILESFLSGGMVGNNCLQGREKEKGEGEERERKEKAGL